jgi:predicted enzyme related to lactoylglutathione lyase
VPVHSSLGRAVAGSEDPGSASPAILAAAWSEPGCRGIGPALECRVVTRLPLGLIEFPADDTERARRFWAEFLGVELQARDASEGEGWQTRPTDPGLGVHARGGGPGDSFSLPYFVVSDLVEALQRVRMLGGSVVHPGERWAICRDSEGSPFGLSRGPAAE